MMYFPDNAKRFESVAQVLNAISYDPAVNYYRAETRNGVMTVVRWGGEFGGHPILTPEQIADVLNATNQEELLDVIKRIVTDYRFIENTIE